MIIIVIVLIILTYSNKSPKGGMRPRASASAAVAFACSALFALAPPVERMLTGTVASVCCALDSVIFRNVKQRTCCRLDL